MCDDGEIETIRPNGKGDLARCQVTNHFYLDFQSPLGTLESLRFPYSLVLFLAFRAKAAPATAIEAKARQIIKAISESFDLIPS